MSSSPSSVFSNLPNVTVAGLGLPGGASPVGGFFGGGFPALNLGPTVAMKMNMETAFRVYLDRLRMNTITASVQAYYGSPWTSEFYNEPVKGQMKTYLNTPWRPLYRTTYTARFYFRTPYFMCDDPDGSPTPANKTYVY